MIITEIKLRSPHLPNGEELGYRWHLSDSYYSKLPKEILDSFLEYDEGDLSFEIKVNDMWYPVTNNEDVWEQGGWLYRFNIDKMDDIREEIEECIDDYIEYGTEERLLNFLTQLVIYDKEQWKEYAFSYNDYDNSQSIIGHDVIINSDEIQDIRIIKASVYEN